MVGRERNQRRSRLAGRCDDVLHAGRCGGSDGGLVLAQALAHFVERIGADEKEPVDTGERGCEPCRVVIVRLAHRDAARRPVAEFFGPAAGGDDACGRHVQRLDEMLQHRFSEMA